MMHISYLFSIDKQAMDKKNAYRIYSITEQRW